VDFAAIPPEINSARMYAGPGAASLTEAANAWSMLSQELSTAATEYGSAVTALGGVWQGASAAAMTAAAHPFLGWLQSTSELAGQSAVQANAAVGAFTTAYTATVPPQVVAANRTQLTTLIVTNLLGQNTALIAAVEAAYAEMWAQDATAMYAYSAASGTASSGLPKFTQAPQTTSGSTAPAATVASSDLFNSYAEAFLSSGAFQDIPLAFLVLFNGITAEKTSELAAEGAAAEAFGAPIVAAPSPSSVKAPAAVSAARGAAGRIGGLTVPPSWARSLPQPEPAASPVFAKVTNPKAAIPAVPFMPVTGLRSNQGKVRSEPEYGVVRKVIPGRHPSGG
jgi:PPE-repeat protein